MLTRVLALDPSLIMTRYYLGRAEAQLGDTDAAIADFEQTIQTNADGETTRQAYFQLSRVYRRLGNTAASEQAQQQYRLLDRQSKLALEERLKQRRLRGDRDTALPVGPSGEGANTP